MNQKKRQEIFIVKNVSMGILVINTDYVTFEAGNLYALGASVPYRPGEYFFKESEARAKAEEKRKLKIKSKKRGLDALRSQKFVKNQKIKE